MCFFFVCFFKRGNSIEMKFLSKPCQPERKDAASSQMMATSNPPGLRYLGPADLGNLGGGEDRFG